MRTTVELSNVHDVVFIFEDSGFVVVNIEVVWCREDGHDGRESCSLGLSVHTISTLSERN